MFVIILSSICLLYDLLYIFHCIAAKKYSAVAGTLILMLVIITLTAALNLIFVK